MDAYDEVDRRETEMSEFLCLKNWQQLLENDRFF